MIEKLPVIAASAAVILVMLAVAFALGFRTSASLSEERIRALAGEEGADVDAVALSDDGRMALARLSSGKLMVARVMGLDVSARIVAESAVKLRRKGRQVIAVFGDPGYPSLHMKLDSPPAWLADMTQGEAR